jgi:transcriptional regulator with GAF, ATPase, and Fis domain
MAHLEVSRWEALLLDSWLPDLEVGEFATLVRSMYPAMDLMRTDGAAGGGGVRSPRRNELLHALREAQEDAAWSPDDAAAGMQMPLLQELEPRHEKILEAPRDEAFLPGMVGRSEPMRELARMIRLVAPRSTTVLIEGETGTGKEVVAKAVHQLSARASKSFTVLNCAAIPETLLEAELFGHARGAFTGAVQSRVGRIEAADGGTLFLDEIGEMALGLQAKMLRFLESGELQRVGDNETTRVDVRVIAATHQPLEQRSEEGLFRLDLYHRLAVFPVEVPALRDRMEDLPLLVEYFLEQMGRDMPRKRISESGMTKLQGYSWPGNVRELMHVLERGTILAGDRAEIGVEDVRIRVIPGG